MGSVLEMGSTITSAITVCAGARTAGTGARTIDAFEGALSSEALCPTSIPTYRPPQNDLTWFDLWYYKSVYHPFPEPLPMECVKAG